MAEQLILSEWCACGHHVDEHRATGECNPCGAAGEGENAYPRCARFESLAVLRQHVQPNVSVRLIKVGVNMGDHGQDVAYPVEISPEETLRDAAIRLIDTGDRWTRTDYSWRLEVQLVEPTHSQTQSITREPF